MAQRSLLTNHHAKVGKCKIDDEHVGRASKFFSLGEQANEFVEFSK